MGRGAGEGLEEAVPEEGERLPLLETDAPGVCLGVYRGEPWKDGDWDLGDIELGDLGSPQ